MPFWRLYYHLVWATHSRESTLVDEVEIVVRRVLQQVAEDVRVQIRAIGTMPDPIHVVASIPPVLAVAEVVKRMKGTSSFSASHDGGGRRENDFAWQSEYGVHSFGEQALPKVVGYVENQRERHAHKNLWSQLEQTIGVPLISPTPSSPEGTSLG